MSKTISLKKAIRFMKKNKEVEIYYTWNQDQHSRWRRITLRQDQNHFMPSNGSISSCSDAFTVWDLDCKNWRNLRMRNIKQLRLHGDELFTIDQGN